MKILIVGEGRYPLYEVAFANWYEQQGFQVSRFFWKDLFRQTKWSISYWQEKFRVGPIINTINQNLIEEIQKKQPDFVFIYRGAFIKKETIDEIKKTTLVFGYNNDDPFSTKYPFYYWKIYKKSAILYDHMFCYREKNIHDYLSLGLKSDKLSVLLPYYIKEKDYKNRIKDKKIDAVFIGHFENDGRDYMFLNALKSGLGLEIYGTGWEKSKVYKSLTSYLGRSIFPIYGDEYRDKINESHVSVVLFSKLNNDLYTRRCFEIPAAGSVMFCEDNSFMRSLWESEKHAFYFEKENFTKQLRKLLEIKGKLPEIELMAKERLTSMKFEVGDRCQQVINKYYEINSIRR